MSTKSTDAFSKVMLKCKGIHKQQRACHASGKHAPGKQPAKRAVSKAPKRNDWRLAPGVGIVKIYDKRLDEKELTCTWVDYRVKDTGGQMLWITDTEAEHADQEMVDKFEENYTKRIAKQQEALALVWLQCCATGCSKWRVVTAGEKRKYDAGDEAWYCLENKDRRKNVCSKPQDARATWPAVLKEHPEMKPAAEDSDDENVTVASLATPLAGQDKPAGNSGDAMEQKDPPGEIEPDDVEDEESGFEDEVDDEKEEAACKAAKAEMAAANACRPKPASSPRQRLVAGIEQRQELHRERLAPPVNTAQPTAAEMAAARLKLDAAPARPAAPDTPAPVKPPPGYKCRPPAPVQAHLPAAAGKAPAAPAPPAAQPAPLYLQAYKADVESLAWHPRAINANETVNGMIYDLALGTNRDACLLDRVQAVEKALLMESVESVGLMGRIFACKMLHHFLRMEKGLVGLQVGKGQTLAARIVNIERQVGKTPPADFTAYFCYRIEHLEGVYNKLYGR